MSIHFEAALGSAVDSQNGLVIYEPRMQPGRTPDEVEYQYAIYQGTHRDGLGCFGLSTQIEEDGQPVSLFTLDLGQDWVIDSMVKLKQRFHIEGDVFEFVQGLAEGLVKVFETRTDNTNAAHYVALTQEAPLRVAGLNVPDPLSHLSNGQIILAEVRVPARHARGSVP